MGGTVRNEGRRLVDRRGVDRIVVAGQEEEGDDKAPHGVKGPDHGTAVQVVRLEDVPRHDNEGASHIVGNRGDHPDGVETGLRIAGLGLATEEMAGHADLPVAGVDEPRHRVPPARHVLVLVMGPCNLQAGRPASPKLCPGDRRTPSVVFACALSLQRRRYRPARPRPGRCAG